MNTATYNNLMRDFANMANAMNRTGDTRAYDYARNGGHNEAEERISRLPVDAYATEDAFVLTAYLPGVKPEEVAITVEGEELTIRGQFQPLPENVSFLKRELFHGRFERRLTFNVPVNMDGSEAVFEHGVLTLSVPKAEAVKPKQIKVVAK